MRSVCLITVFLFASTELLSLFHQLSAAGVLTLTALSCAAWLLWRAMPYLRAYGMSRPQATVSATTLPV